MGPSEGATGKEKRGMLLNPLNPIPPHPIVSGRKEGATGKEKKGMLLKLGLLHSLLEVWNMCGI